MVKMLLVTGQLAKDLVKKYAQESNIETKVLALKVSVAAFLTPKYIAQEIVKEDLRGFDMILVPGLISGDVTLIEKAVGIPAFKGSRYAADLPTVLSALGQVELSKVIPACDLLREDLQRRAREELVAVERNRVELLKKEGNILVGDLALGKDFPMRVMTEIIDAPLLSNEQIRQKARRYVKFGADIIDVGMMAEESRPAEAERAVKAVKSAVNVPVSIDTLDPREAKGAVDAGAQMILSVDAGNLEEMATFASEVAVVIIPTNHNSGYFPKRAEERVMALEENVKRAAKCGFVRVLGDLVLDSVNVPGIVESLVAYHGFAARNPCVPLLFGAGNVTELMDADSVGVNALLVGIASEIGVSILLTTEQSHKTRGCIEELATASKMMWLAKRRGSVPKDLALDLLMLKDKRTREEPYNHEVENKTKTIIAEKSKATKLDPKGFFKIMIDRESEAIAALHFSTATQEIPNVLVKGKGAAELCSKIVEMGLVTTLEHAAYFGTELGKAEVALRSGKEYIQGNPVF